ncbi:efflux transporter outer membrane subunit [Chromobacterium subtsugae]|uniref:efflux transporter outer membrane subunit n=1 Tax=Chromobacterium subtsugae TaxID=251747 RepID=UPI0006417D0F|nr:efflux transporter outer membrane subunit [Chromobacterium subtsugae]
MFKPLFLAAALSAALAACAAGPDYQRPQLALPDGQAQAAADVAGWWRQFQEPELDRLIAVALARNQDLSEADARLAQAEALAGIARSQLLPRLDAAADSQRQRVSAALPATAPGGLYDSRDFNLRASWELDLWGRLRREREAAVSLAAASQASRDGLRLAVAAQVAQTYFQLRAYDAQLEVSRRTLANRRAAATLNEKRFRQGDASELDWRQAEAEVAVAEASAAQFERSVAQTETALGVLLGREPRQLLGERIARGRALDALSLPPALPSGLPSDLLARRPDIAASEAGLVAANARIGVAKAAYFPSISLTGALGSASPDLRQLFSGPAYVWSFAGNLAAPVFNFGQTAGAVDVASAGQQQALAQYRKAVQLAFKDAADALSAMAAARRVNDAETARVKALQRAVRLATLRYDSGHSAYLEVLDAERGAFQSELSAVDARLDLFNSAVALYKALGGGWRAS